MGLSMMMVDRFIINFGGDSDTETEKESESE